MHWLTIDTWTLARRALAHWRRQPATVAIGWLFPLLIVVLFGYLLGGQFAVPDGASYFEFLVPGMLALTMVFGVETTMAAIAVDASQGVTDRFRSMPIAAAAILGGRVVADLLHAVVALLLLTACGLLVGWRWHGDAGDVLSALALLLWLRVATVWIGIWLGLLARDPQAVVAVQVLVWPVGFLSTTFVSPASMPGWLGTVAEWNPLSSTVTAVRELLGNPGWESDAWIATHAEPMAVLWPLALVAILVPLSVRSYRRLDG